MYVATFGEKAALAQINIPGRLQYPLEREVNSRQHSNSHAAPEASRLIRKCQTQRKL